MNNGTGIEKFPDMQVFRTFTRWLLLLKKLLRGSIQTKGMPKKNVRYKTQETGDSTQKQQVKMRRSEPQLAACLRC